MRNMSTVCLSVMAVTIKTANVFARNVALEAVLVLNKLPWEIQCVNDD